MKVKQNKLDTVAYIILCILSGGTIWLLRILMSVAIRMALKDDTSE